jgi:hypothetical protein
MKAKMLLIKEITLENCMQFNGLPVNIMVVEHKKGGRQFGHSFYLIGIIVVRETNAGLWYYYIQFTNGNSSGIYNSVQELMKKQSKYFSFYYVEIKKQQ